MHDPDRSPRRPHDDPAVVASVRADASAGRGRPVGDGVGLRAFSAAADLLACGGCEAQDRSRAEALLRSFDWWPDGIGQPEIREFSSALRVASRFERVFSLAPPTAANVALVGATVDPHRFGLSASPRDVSGKSFDPGRAFLGCVGEAVEYLSLQAWGDEEMHHVDQGDLDPRLVVGHGGDRVPCLGATRLADGRNGWLPSDLCIRAEATARSRAWTRSGYGAGATVAGAAAAAVLELIERDAVALWWLGGRPPRSVPLEAMFSGRDASSLASLMSRRGRRSWCLDVTTEFDVPTVVAFSTDAEGGAFAFGAAARLSVADAVSAAFLELAQMEFALLLATNKRAEQGDAALDAVEAGHLRRSTSVALDCDRFRPCDTALHADLEVPSDLGSRLPADCWLVDLTRSSLAIPCVRAVAPDLQTYPVAHVSERLRKCADRHGVDLDGRRRPELV